jgi:hypothetical protein
MLLASLEEIFGPAVVEALGDAFLAAKLGNRRVATRTVDGWLPRDKSLVIFGIWSGAAMYSASDLRRCRAP